MENNTITITYDEFKDVSIEAIAEMTAATGNELLGMAATILLVDIAHRLFEKDELTIDKEEN